MKETDPHEPYEVWPPVPLNQQTQSSSQAEVPASVLKRKVLSISALTVGVLSNVAVIAIWLPLLRLPRGEYIRPMGAVAFEFFVSVLALVVGLPLSFAALRAGAKSSTISLVLCLLPYFVGWATLKLCLLLTGVVMED